METTNATPANPIDTYLDTVHAVHRFIAESAPDGIHPRDRARSTVMSESLEPRTWIGYDFTRESPARASAGLHVDIEERNRFFAADGSQWRTFTVLVRTSWPSYGSASVETNRHRLALMTELNEFAAKIEETFSQEFYSMLLSADEVKAKNDETAKRKILDSVKKIVLANKSKMRVGTERRLELDGPVFESIPEGDYQGIETDDGKTYTFFKAGFLTAYLERKS